MSSITIPTVPTTVPSSSTRVAVPARAGAIGGLAFAASILAQNVLRASAPANDASPTEIIRYYSDHRPVALALAVLFPIGAAGLSAFVATIVSRAKGAARTPAVWGGLGAAAVIVMFAIVSATEPRSPPTCTAAHLTPRWCRACG